MARPLYKTKRWVAVTLILTLLAGAGVFVVQRRSLEKVMGSVPKLSSGPWGELQTWRVNLEQPAEYVAFDQTSWDGPFWSFGPVQAEVVRKHLLESGCSTEQASRLLSTLREQNGDAVLRPSDAEILALTPQIRSKLYLVLAENPKNQYHAGPVLIPDEGVGHMLGGKVSKEVIELTERLSYPRNGFTYFSDRELVSRMACKSDSEKEAFRRAVSASPVVMARILVRPNSNIDSAIMYWGMSMPGVLVKDLRPLFEAQKQLSGGGAVSILYVLPPMARAHLYTTPLPPKDGERLPDCHLTALNFFNERPDPRMSDLKYATQFILENYYEIGAAGVAGDLVLLLNQKGEAVHSATYLAADLVYTKNGINLGQPWVLMELHDMIGSFSAKEPVRVAYFRKKRF